ncbi:hypothetical protein N7537_006208 [Penicillium hordei]|uniref:Uncharacterized protein n=1 Tax=Penicillium hordei TaxID=40994 RepID=A0AAD6H3V4_9EURO|nr:uncharacterized protein N7537_006208 [Penicillium hordei]KAJ5603252.1 hypothetical protein N7537_006208 [Penicillium hordei]
MVQEWFPRITFNRGKFTTRFRSRSRRWSLFGSRLTSLFVLPCPIWGFYVRNLPPRELLNVLPSSLETLYLHVNESGSVGGAIVQLAELAASESFPQLAAIHIKYR